MPLCQIFQLNFSYILISH